MTYILLSISGEHKTCIINVQLYILREKHNPPLDRSLVCTLWDLVSLNISHDHVLPISFSYIFFFHLFVDVLSKSPRTTRKKAAAKPRADRVISNLAADTEITPRVRVRIALRSPVSRLRLIRRGVKVGAANGSEG